MGSEYLLQASSVSNKILSLVLGLARADFFLGLFVDLRHEFQIKNKKLTIVEKEMVMPGASSENELLGSTQETVGVEGSATAISRNTAVLKPTTGRPMGNRCRARSSWRSPKS